VVSLALGLVDGRFKLLTGVPHGILDLKGPGVTSLLVRFMFGESRYINLRQVQLS
jgi:hypothetical protein